MEETNNQSEVDLKTRLLGITTEVGTGIGTDAATTGLLAGGPWGWLAYAGINFGQGAYTNYLVQKHLYGQDNINWGEVIASGGMGMIPFMNIGASKGLSKVVGQANTIKRGIVGGALTGLAGEQTRVGIDEQRFLNPLEAVTAAGVGGTFGGGLTAVSKGIKGRQINQLQEGKNILGKPLQTRPPIPGGLQEQFSPNLKARMMAQINGDNLQPKGSADITGRSSERFLYGEDVFANMPKANIKALAKLNITDNESKLFISQYNTIGRDSAGAIESVFRTYNDFEKIKSKVFPAFAEEMKDVTQTKPPQLDHVAQLVASLGFFDGQPVKYWPEIAKIVVKEGVFGLGHDPKNLKYLPFDVHTVKSNFWRDNIGDAGEKFFKGRDLSTLPKLKAAAKDYAALIRQSNLLVEQATAQYKLLNKTNISQIELEEFITRLGSDPLESKYNIKQVKSILEEMEQDGFIQTAKQSQKLETQKIKAEQKIQQETTKKQAQFNKEFAKSLEDSESYGEWLKSEQNKFKGRYDLRKGLKDDQLRVDAEAWYTYIQNNSKLGQPQQELFDTSYFKNNREQVILKLMKDILKKAKRQ